MAKHNELGKEGEALAKNFLEQQGYTILHSNWRHLKLEVDLIASKNNLLHFVEVKTRRSDQKGFPEQNVGKAKLNHLIRAAEEYLCQYPEWKRIQYDIVSVTLEPQLKVLLLEDVFL